MKFTLEVGDKVWHINQCRFMSKNVKPFTVKDRYQYSNGTVDYIIQLGQVHMLVNANQVVKVVK